MPGIPYPPVFRHWDRQLDLRVATSTAMEGVRVEFSGPGRPGVWTGPTLTEGDACLLAASLLERAGAKRRLIDRVVREAEKVG